jgi:hypothetical protein
MYAQISLTKKDSLKCFKNINNITKIDIDEHQEEIFINIDYEKDKNIKINSKDYKKIHIITFNKQTNETIDSFIINMNKIVNKYVS